MKPEEALNILQEATEPKNVGKITRLGYAQIEEALSVIRSLADLRVPAIEDAEPTEPAAK